MVTTIPTATDSQIQGMSDTDLLWHLNEGKNLMFQTRAFNERLEYEVIQRAQARGAKAIITERYTAELEASVTYDQSRLTPLLEALPEEGIRESYAPEHEVTQTVPAKWNLVKAKKWAEKVGGVALNIIMEARLEGAPKVKLTVKAPVNGVS